MDIDLYKDKFGNFAKDYTKYRRPYEKELTDLYFSLAPRDGIQVLDVACGTGKFTETLVRGGINVSGVDIDPLMIEEAKSQAALKKLSINYKIGEVEHLPYEDSKFDVVSVGTAFHWFVNDSAIAEIKRVLKPNGLLFIFWTLTVKDIPEENSIPSDFLRTFNWIKVPSELRDLGYISSFLNKHDFKNVSTSQIISTNAYNVEEYVGLMKTSSNFSLLSSDERARFVDELTAILTSKLDGRKEFVLEDEIQVVYGFKK